MITFFKNRIFNIILLCRTQIYNFFLTRGVPRGLKFQKIIYRGGLKGEKRLLIWVLENGDGEGTRK